MIRLRAFKGRIGNTDFYLSMATFGEVARMVSYKMNDKEWPTELRQQRPINMSRVKNSMVPYLLENDDHFYSALVVEHVRPDETKHDVTFIADQDDPSTGWVEMNGSEILEAQDGQHRLKSIEMAVEQSPEIAKEKIGLVIVPHKTVKSAQQRFSDLNKNAKPTPKALNVMFEQREEAALLAKSLAKNSKMLDDRVNQTSSNLSKRSPYIVTIASLYEAVKIVEPTLTGEIDAKSEQLVHYWDTALAAMPDFERMVEGKTTPGDIRTKYVYASGLGFEVLAEVIRAVVVSHQENWERVLTEGLPCINWELGYSEWEGIALIAGRIAIARAPRRRTATLIKHLLGLPVGVNDFADLQEAYSHLDRELPKPAFDPIGLVAYNS